MNVQAENCCTEEAPSRRNVCVCCGGVPAQMCGCGCGGGGGGGLKESMAFVAKTLASHN